MKNKKTPRGVRIEGSGSLFVPFFIIHFGLFMAGHLMFIMVLFGAQEFSNTSWSSYELIVSLLKGVIFPIGALMISHGMSFFLNFIKNKEYNVLNLAYLMYLPYTRVFVMHITIILGSLLILLFETPVAGAIFLIILKTCVDIFSHKREHQIPKENMFGTGKIFRFQ